MDIYIKLAKLTIYEYLKNNRLPEKKEIPVELLNIHAGCFVSLHLKKDGNLRGCIGTILPTCKNLGAEIINNAVAACQDPRFEEVKIREYDDLDIQVDVLQEPEQINSEESLDPKKYGVIVKAADGRTGLLLPDLEGVDNAKDQIAIARQKAGISNDEIVYLYRFLVTRHKEN
ncbi:MAG: AmmeMemoRadiSam system protein A [Patescibacteria group bacterium]|nr:AmmeMemoRadiSam system protein A [Patescibacteria group bacterium]